MFRPALTLFSLAFLAACGGGSGGGPAIEPTPRYEGPAIDAVAGSGFATASSVVTGGTSFNAVNTIRFLGDGDGVLSLDEQDVELAISDDGQNISAIIAGQRYALDTEGDGRYTYRDDTANILFNRVFTAGPEAEIVYARAFVEDTLNSSTFVIGFDTDPDTVVAKSGMALLSGEVFLAARNEFLLSTFIGPATLEVDFDAMTIGGGFTLTNNENELANAEPTLTDIVIGTSEFILEETDIVGNGFDGTFSLVDGAVSGIIVDPVYNGRLYGSEAQTAAGQIAATVTVGDDAEPTYLVGAFAAN